MPKPKYIVNAENREEKREAPRIREAEKEEYGESQADEPSAAAKAAATPIPSEKPSEN